MESLDLDTYTLDKLLGYFERNNKFQYTTKNDIYSLARQKKLTLSLRMKRGVLRPAHVQNEIDEIEKTIKIRAGKYLDEDLKSKDYQDKTAKIHELKIKGDVFFEENDKEILFEILELSKPSLLDNRQRVLLVNYDATPCIPRDLFDKELIELALLYADKFNGTHCHGEGKPFLTDGDSIVITKANLNNYLKPISRVPPPPPEKQLEFNNSDEVALDENISEVNGIQTYDGVVFYSIDAITKALAKKEYPRAKPFFDKQGYHEGSLCDNEMAILLLASYWEEDIKKAIQSGVITQYNTFGKKHNSGYFSKDGQLKETDINNWIESEGRTFQLDFKQIRIKNKALLRFVESKKMLALN